MLTVPAYNIDTAVILNSSHLTETSFGFCGAIHTMASVSIATAVFYFMDLIIDQRANEEMCQPSRGGLRFEKIGHFFFGSLVLISKCFCCTPSSP